MIDAGEPSNHTAEGIGGLLGHGGRPPDELYRAGRGELTKYSSVELRVGRVAGGTVDDDVFELDLENGARETAWRVLLALGCEYRPPQLPGVPERWGRSVFHCPFCHGWEVRDRPLGVLDPGPRGPERALLLTLWSDDVVLFTDGAAIESEDAERLARRAVEVEERNVVELRGPDESLAAVVLADESERPCEGLLVVAPMYQRSALASTLGARIAESGSPIEAVEVDAMFRTSVAGLYAAGDVSATTPPSVATAIAAGSNAAKTIVHDLVEELGAAD